MAVVAFTVGSLGDILAVSEILIKIGTKLYDCTHTSEACRLLVSDLQILHRILHLCSKAIEPYQNTEHATYMKYLISQMEVDGRAFLAKVTKHHQSLASCRGIKEFVGRVAWAVAEDEEVERFRKRISRSQASLTTLLAALNP